MLDADAVINNSSQKVGGSNAYPDPAPKKWVGPDPQKHTGSTPLDMDRKAAAPAVAIDRYRLTPGPQQQTRRTLLQRSTGGTERQTDRRAESVPLHRLCRISLYHTSSVKKSDNIYDTIN